MTEQTAPEQTESLHCPECSAPFVAGDRFCEECGAEVAVRKGASPDPDTPVPGARACVSCGGTEIDADRFCARCGFQQPAARDHTELDLGAVAGVSDRGLRHHRNEDALALRRVRTAERDEVVAVVCDGVSTSDNPDVASQVAADCAADVLAHAVTEGTDLVEASREAILRAAAAVAELAEPGRLEKAPACTIVSAVVTGSRVVVGWIGDSRVYWLAEPGGPTPARALTEDDSWAVTMAATGRMTAAEAFADNRSHALVAWLGADADEIAPHVHTIEPGGPGAVLLCSDGLWNYLWAADQLAERALPAAVDAPLAEARALTEFALAEGGHDNVTVVLVPFPPTTSSDTGDADPPAGPRSSQE
jgi:serine/threonine protein phosphatase PrpC